MILNRPGSEDQMKTPTDCCASIFHAALICPCTVRPSSVPSQGGSMKDRERPCSIRRRLRSSPNVLQRSVEPATQSGHTKALSHGSPPMTILTYVEDSNSWVPTTLFDNLEHQKSDRVCCAAAGAFGGIAQDYLNDAIGNMRWPLRRIHNTSVREGL